MSLTAGIRVKDGELWAEECLRSLSGLVDDIVILDDGSTDRTGEVDMGTPTHCHYDGCGNTTARQAPAGTTYYAYDTENLMTRIDFADGSHCYYTYDADSKRVSQRTPEGYTEFIYQGPDMLKLQMERDEAGETQVHYTMGAGLESMRRDAGGGMASGDSSFFHYNHLGTTIALTNPAQSVTDTYRHDAWGVPLAATGSTVNPHTYVGRERYYRMPTPDFYHLGFRDYGAGVGRFTTVDPLRLAATNWMAYVRNGPSIRVDKMGLQDGPDAGIPEAWQGCIEPGYRGIAPDEQPSIGFEPPSQPSLPSLPVDGRIPRAQPIYPGVEPSGPGTGAGGPITRIQPLPWENWDRWAPRDSSHPFWRCMDDRDMSAQSPCWAHFIRYAWGPHYFPRLCTGSNYRYLAERCKYEDACVCAQRTCVPTPANQCGHVSPVYPKPPGLGTEPWPFPEEE